MTENKRFTMCFEQNDINGWTMSIVDWETKEPFNYTTYEVHSSSITDTKDEMEDLCLLLNELNDENEKLKIFLKAVNEELSLANRDCDILEEENEQLKFENNELKCALALDAVDYIIADGKKIDIPPYYEFEQRYDHVIHRKEYDGYD